MDHNVFGMYWAIANVVEISGDLLSTRYNKEALQILTVVIGNYVLENFECQDI